MRPSRYLPEGIPGIFARWYALVPGRLARPAQRRIAAAVAAALPPEARLVVDVGCGPGWLSIELARRRPALRVVAVDLSPTMARICGRNARGRGNVDVRCENAEALSLPDGAVDLVVSAESMHHWRRPVAVLDELWRVLRPGGVAWILDGRSDFTAADLAGFTRWGETAPPAPARALIRAVLGVHGFSGRDWREHVPELARRSRFGTGEVEPFGFYRRLELRKGTGEARSRP